MAITASRSTTTVVTSRFDARVDGLGYLILTTQRAGKTESPRRSTRPCQTTRSQWNRLLSVVEEQAQVLAGTAFSTSAREAGDISAGVFDTADACWPRR